MTVGIKGFDSAPTKRVRRRPGDEGAVPLDRAHRIREHRRIGERIPGMTVRERNAPPPPEGDPPEGDPPPPPEGDPPPDTPPEKIHPYDRPISLGRKKGGES